MKQKLRRGFVWVCLLLLGALFAGCSGGGSSSSSVETDSSVSGVAAAGAPLSGQVWLKDSLDEMRGPVTLDSDGNFTFDVDGLTPPFIINAEGVAGSTGYDLHSMATAAGTANVNPLTEMATAAALGADPATVFADPTSFASAQNNAAAKVALAAAVAAIKEMLQPLLAAYDAEVDFIGAPYQADGTGIDLLFDLVEIETDDGTISVTDKASATLLLAATIGDQGIVVPEGEELTAEEVVQVTQGQTVLQQVGVFFQGAITKMVEVAGKYGAEELTFDAAAEELESFYVDSETFGYSNGWTRDQQIQDIIEDFVFFQHITGVRNFSIKPMGEDKYVLNFVVDLNDGSVDSPEGDMFVVINVGTAETPDWRITGNGYLTETWLMAASQRHIWPEGAVTLTGLEIDVEAPQLEGIHYIDYAVVTGPGLADDGLILSRNEYGDLEDLELSEADIACARDKEDGEQCYGSEWAWGFVVLDDDTIATISVGDEYTFKYYNASDVLIETRILPLRQSPLKSTELTDANFPTFSNLSSHHMDWVGENLVGRTYAFGYAYPTALAEQKKAADLEFGYSYSNAEGGMWGWNWAEKGLWSDSSSVSLTTPALPDGAVLQDNAKAEIWFETSGGYEVSTSWHFTID